nr:hypothetical protein RAR13_11790 [Aminobacter aminovorans]
MGIEVMARLIAQSMNCLACSAWNAAAACSASSVMERGSGIVSRHPELAIVSRAVGDAIDLELDAKKFASPSKDDDTPWREWLELKIARVIRLVHHRSCHRMKPIWSIISCAMTGHRCS